MRVILVSHDAGGTIPPMLALAEAFARGGDEVVWLGQPSIESRAVAAGAAFRPFDGVPDYTPRALIEDQLEIAAPLIAGFGIGDQLRALAAESAAELLVIDANLAGALAAAETLSQPSAVLLHSLHATFTVTWFADVWPLLAPFVNETRAHFGLDERDTWGALFEGHQRVLSVVPEAFDTDAAQWPASMRHFGFLLPATAVHADEVQFPDGDNPTVLVGLSTTYQQQERFLQDILDALGSLDVRGLATTAGQVDAQALRCPPNVRLRRFVDHRALLPVTDVVVTHAGLGTISAALGAGVPVVCVPIARDQHLNASRVVALGAGVDLGAGPDAAGIAANVQRVLDDSSFRTAAQRVAEVSAAAGGAPAAVRDLRALAR